MITTTPYIKNGAKSGQQRLVNHQVTQAFVASSEKTPEELFTWVLPLATLYVLCFNDQAIPPEDRRESLQEVDESLETATEGEWSTPTSPTASLPTATQAIATAMVQAQETQLVLVGDVERHSNITLFEIVDARGTRHRFDAANAGDDIFMQGIRIMRRLYRDRVTNRAGVQDFAFRIETAEEDFRSPWVRIQVALASGALYLIAVNSNTDATPAFTTRWESESTELNDGWRRIGESSYAKLRASETNISLDSINSALNTVMDWARGGGRINSRPGRAIATLALISESIRNDVAAFMLDTMLGGVTARVGRPGRPESAREFDGNSYERLWTHLELLFLDWNDMSLEYYNQPRLAPITLTHSQSFARGRAADTRLAPEKRKLWRSILKIIESLQLLQYTDSPPPNNN
ncbi:MAG: hypothetical protein HC865_25960 [Cyanobacteria bacterium RU_5_0]|nr:hypothetical protein [Cyanobacteria bacterium RU_5_0]